MSRLSSQEPEETKPDGFDVMSTRVRMDLLQTEPVVFDEMSGHLPLCQWQKNRCWWWDIRTFAGLFVATELGVFEKMSGHFSRMYLCRQKPDTLEHLQTCSRWQNQVFVMRRKNHSRCIWCRQNRTSGQSETCFVATQQEMCFLCLNLTRAALSRLKIEDWSLTNVQKCDVKECKASTYPPFAELCVANIY